MAEAEHDRLEFCIGEVFPANDELAQWVMSLSTGWRKAAPLRCLIDSFFGPRILGPLITGEIGPLSDDFN